MSTWAVSSKQEKGQGTEGPRSGLCCGDLWAHSPLSGGVPGSPPAALPWSAWWPLPSAWLQPPDSLHWNLPVSSVSALLWIPSHPGHTPPLVLSPVLAGFAVLSASPFNQELPGPVAPGVTAGPGYPGKDLLAAHFMNMR